MISIVFIDTEIDPNSCRIIDIGGVKEDGSFFHSPSIVEFKQFLSGSTFVCGHNILNHDIHYIGAELKEEGIAVDSLIDTLFISPLLFPKKPYHALLKDDKLQSEEKNNPLNDSMKARDLFYGEVAAFQNLKKSLQEIYYLLLKDTSAFSGFYRYLDYDFNETVENHPLEVLIRAEFSGEICANANLTGIIEDHPIELAYSLALISASDRSSITPPWVLKNYPEVDHVMFLLRNKSCVPGCTYCDKSLDIHRGLKRYFGFNAYRLFGHEPLQEMAVQAAVDNKSILAVFPTGGGKSITFQVPALMAGESVKGLTVVISPLQSLMKDQVDNLERNGITEAVTINGLLDPIERAKSFERVEDGSASLLYISPEALRSKSMERLLLNRKIVRFVIDEAHCFSAWGQDFRVDYQYIGDFIKLLQEHKGLKEGIAVSCFTATAKQKVIEDIKDYFKKKLSLDLELFTSKVARTNLHYKVFQKGSEEEKYLALRDLIERKDCPTIIYVSRTRKAYELAERLTLDGFNAKPYHGKMEVQEKTANQNAFIAGEVTIMVATAAFGMGVDKKDVGQVIHYELSDSLENYVQEAGRAGRDESLEADCFVLFNEDDLSKHFVLLNQTKLSIKEIQQVWKAIKEITKFRSSVSNSALEIARKAGWDDNVMEIETRVVTAIAALENAGYLKRQQNMPRIFANSILSRNAEEAINKINSSVRFNTVEKDNAARIIKTLFSSRSRKQNSEDTGESRIDYISDRLGILKEEVINIVNLLREEHILADAKDLTAFIKKGEHKNQSLHILSSYGKIENYLISVMKQEEQTFHIKELNEAAQIDGCEDVTPGKIRTILNIWAIKSWIKRGRVDYSKSHIVVLCQHPKEQLQQKLIKRHELAKFILILLYERSKKVQSIQDAVNEEVLVEFSVHELKSSYEAHLTAHLFQNDITIHDIEDALFYLSKIEAIKIEGGFMVVYNRLTIERLEQDNKKRYTKEDYQPLNQFYENKVQQIHIVGEYAKKMIEDYRGALQFTDDYFQLNYSSFLKKYFPGSKVDELRLRMTPGKFKQLFGELSPKQLSIINDNETKYIVVAAGPGSGKTRILVHKLASLLLMEDVKHEQLLMLTFSRAAATELKKRLLKLIGGAANYIDIKTFHSYCFDLLGKVGNLDVADKVIETTIEKIQRGEVELSRITKTVLVIDEAQDMDKNEFELIKSLMKRNEEMRVIAVGDDDQNIYGFRGSSAEYLEKFAKIHGARTYELVENYRSKNNLVEFTNQFLKKITHRLKVEPIVARQTDDGLLRVIHYQGRHLIKPLVGDIIQTDLVGTTCVLTKTNEEALQVAGLLLKAGLHARLIQENERFDLDCLVELRYFILQLDLAKDISIIDEDTWTQAVRAVKSKYQKSSKLDLSLRLIDEFAAVNPGRKYRTDFIVFIGESKLEDFYHEGGESILVSTIHKAKGKEFDNVFLLLEGTLPSSDEDFRLLYVAMTRAKSQLVIHLNGVFLDGLFASGLQRVEDPKPYAASDEKIMSLTHKDIQLGYFKFIESKVIELSCGDGLQVSREGCNNAHGELVLKFSRKFQETIAKQDLLGFKLKRAIVNFMVYWQDKDAGKDVQIVLPNLYFERQTSVQEDKRSEMVGV